MKTLTIFTPTYNRAKCLDRLYQSLIQQNERDFFEWLVVDDGSTDETERLVASYIDEGLIDIRYIKKENGGKPSAYNMAIDIAESELFFCVDSDDWLVENAVQKIRLRFYEIFQDTSISGFAGLCVDYKGNLIEKENKKEFKCNTMQIRDVHKGADKPEIVKLSLLKNYRFPIINGEKFITEAYVFDVLTKKYPLLYTNDILMGKEYLVGGLTDQALAIRINNINSTLMYYQQRVLLTKGKIARVKAKINFNRFALHAKRKTKYKFWYLPALIIAQKDKKKLKDCLMR